MPFCPMVRKFKFWACTAFVLIFTLLGVSVTRLRKYNTWESASRRNVSRLHPGTDERSSVLKPGPDRHSKSSVNPVVAAKLEMMWRYFNGSANATASSTESTTPYPAERVGRYLMLNPELCRRGGVEELDVIIVVHTAPDHFDKRQRIRDTFGRESLFLPFRVRVAFMLGKPRDGSLDGPLRLEHAARNDTVMGDFVDDYRNLTLKGVLGYRWVSEHCANSKFVLKIDDDVIVNTYKLLYAFLGHMKGKRKSIFCNVWEKGSIPIYRKGRWKVEPYVFPGLDSFPYNYCSGFVVIITTDLIGPMFEAATATPFFWIDDVYLFGMLPSVVGGVTYYNYEVGRNVTFRAESALRCTMALGLRCPIFASLITIGSFGTIGH